MTPWEFIVLRAVDLASGPDEAPYAVAADVALFMHDAVEETELGATLWDYNGRELSSVLMALRRRGLVSNDGPAYLRGGQLAWAPTLAGRDVLDA